LKAIFISILLLTSIKVFSQHKVEGVIKDSTGELCIGVSILETGTNSDTISDINGEFQINTLKDTSILIFDYLGYATKTISVTKDTFLNIILDHWYYESKWKSIGLIMDGFNSTYGLQISNGFDEHPLIHFEDFDDSWLYKASVLTNFKKDYAFNLKFAHNYWLRRVYMPTVEYKAIKYVSNKLDYKALTASFNIDIIRRFDGVTTIETGYQRLNGENNLGVGIGILKSHRQPDLCYGFQIGYWNNYLTYDLFFQSFIFQKQLSLGIHFERIEQFNFLNFQLNYVFNKVSTNLN